MLKKPSTCQGCPLHLKGRGFSLPVGPIAAKILLVGEALGSNEAAAGRPFVGAAGWMLTKLLRLSGIEREDVRIHNVVSCQPPGNWLEGAPWESGAVQHCDQYLQKVLNEEAHKVVVPLGGVAARSLLNIPKGTKNAAMKNLHGTVTRDILDRFWIVPTYHPSFLQRGASNMMGTVIHDLILAREIASTGFVPPEETLIIDPPVEAFQKWSEGLEGAVSRHTSTRPFFLGVDIETPEKEKGKDEEDLEEDEDRSYIITRVNFAYEHHEAITVPFQGPYIPIIKRILSNEKIHFTFWNRDYDRPRLIANDCPPVEPTHDKMWGWHLLQSNVPRGLGFVAPFFSKRPPWKHLSEGSPGEYAAIDGIQQIRVSDGIYTALVKNGQWETYQRHIYELDTYALEPAEEVGLYLSKQKLEVSTKKLEKIRKEIALKLHDIVPDSIVPPDKSLKTLRNCSDKDGNLLPGWRSVTKSVMGYKCCNCGKEGVNKAHPRTKKCKGAKLEFIELEQTFYELPGTFNPSSPLQVKAYLLHKKYKLGKNKAGKDSTDADALESLRKKHGKKDPFFDLILDDREVSKALGTYFQGMLKRQDENGRVHPQFTHAPSTMRLSCRNPNLQNLVSEGKKETKYNLGHEFRGCVEAIEGCTLIEADFSGIEAVLTGWFANDPDYIRLAKLGVHAFLCSHKVGNPASVAWDDDKLRSHLKEIKKGYKVDYNKCKRVVHGSAYGMTPRGMMLNYPDDFKTTKEAKELQDLLFEVAPKVREWQKNIIERANKQHYLGGSDHPFRYKHWFWDVVNYKKIKKSQVADCKEKGIQVIETDRGDYLQVMMGADAKRAIAFYPQSTAGGIIRETCLRLFKPGSKYYIGQEFNGETPFRMPIHDSIFLEVPDERVEYVMERLVKAMSDPFEQLPLPSNWNMGTHLAIGIEVEKGKNWAEMEVVDHTKYLEG